MLGLFSVIAVLTGVLIWSKGCGDTGNTNNGRNGHYPVQAGPYIWTHCSSIPHDKF